MPNLLLKTVYRKLNSLRPKDRNKKINILLAVSGGADSIAMLHSVFISNKKLNYDISVITVNHNIRAEEETFGDAQFVFEFCKSLASVTHLIFLFHT